MLYDFLAKAIDVLFSIYSLLIILYLLSGWFPQLRYQRWMQMIAYYVEPYLDIFRRILPPFGIFDLSPILAFLALQLLERLAINMLDLLNRALFGLLR